MKVLNIAILAIVLAFALASCDRDSGPVMFSEPVSPSITSPSDGGSFTLTEEEASEELLTLEWSESDYGYAAAVEYTVQMAETGDNFENPRNIATTTNTSYTITVSAMNTHLINMGFPADVAADVQLRVVASLHNSRGNDVISDPISLSVTPYTVVVEYAELQVPGNYQAASGYGGDWSPDDPEIARLYSLSDDGNYEGYVYFAEEGSMFKFTQGASWDTNWGSDGLNGSLEPDGPDIPIDPGYYKINVDLNNLSFETLQTEWGLIGSATPGGWDSDTTMEYDPEERVWSVTVDLEPGDFKFRANQDWDLNYGDDTGAGTLSEGGADIPLDSAGNYTIILNLSEAIYTYEVIEN